MSTWDDWKQTHQLCHACQGEGSPTLGAMMRGETGYCKTCLGSGWLTLDGKPAWMPQYLSNNSRPLSDAS